jgi:hypothetical protein
LLGLLVNRYSIKVETTKKDVLVDVVYKHFLEQEVDEVNTIILFSNNCINKQQQAAVAAAADEEQ